MTTTTPTPAETGDYNMRFVSTNKVKKALKKEQNRIYQETDELVPVMVIAEQWLQQRADEVLKATP